MGSIFRNHYRDMIETAISTQIAAQGDSKTMKSHVKELQKQASNGLNPIANDARAFKALVGKKGGI
jgi:hypothetical protein